MFDSVLQMLGMRYPLRLRMHYMMSFIVKRIDECNYCTHGCSLFSVGFLLHKTGPDVELIQEILSQVGKRHKDFGVQQSYFPHMGQALVFAIEKLLGADQFTAAHKAAWTEVYEEMSSEILKSM